jgi:hypothetical protein
MLFRQSHTSSMFRRGVPNEAQLNISPPGETPFSNKDRNSHLWLEAGCFVTSHATNLLKTRNR